MSNVGFDEKAVFNTARQIADAVARDGYLEIACRDDPEALQRIRELLRAHAQEASFLESPAVAPAAPAAPLESPGATVGPYKLLEQIGEGGFGVVFMAEQTTPVRRRVALKVIKPGMDTKQVIGRFEAERQALALMDHPNIARVLDAGETAMGRPYFVMELVRGVPITEYCDAHRLTPRQRLELFVTVCHAVQHAHQKGIVHRDLKPTNVLVTTHDARPVAKVIDFGIAKATGGQLTEKTVFTAFAQMIGTPLYMSPEQASLGGFDIDTRSDIYSLGVLLYELLTGTTPFDQARLREVAFDEVRRIIREEEPARPSTRLSTSETLPTVAANRRTEPAKLTKLVRGDLDWIVMKALEKDRTRRYETANGLAMDVQRYLADEVVSACPPSAANRLRKLARRHRGALAVAGLVCATLLVVAGSVGWMARDSAARRARNAEAIALLLDQCEKALRAESADRAAIALEAAEQRALDGGAEAREDQLARCRADLKLLRDLDAVDTFRWTAVGNEFPDTQAKAARCQAALADSGVVPDEARAHEAAGRVNGCLVRDRALATLDQWLAAAPSAAVRAVLREADPDPYRDAVRDAIAAHDSLTLVDLAGRPEALTQPARFAAVLGALRDLPVDCRRAVLKSVLWGRPADVAVLMELGLSYWLKDGEIACGDFQAARESVRWFQAAVAAQPGSAAVRNNLGVALSDCDDLDEALACFQEAIRIDETYAPAYANIGVVLGRRENWDGAVGYFRRAVELAPGSARALKSLGIALLNKGDPAAAVPYLEKAVGFDSDDAYAHAQLGRALQATGDTAGAIAQYKTAIRLDPSDTLAPNNLGCILRAEGDVAGAILQFEEVLRIDQNDADGHINLGNALLVKGDVEGAVRHGNEATRLAPDDAIAHYNLGNALRAKKDFERAVAEYRRSIDLDPDCAEAYCNLGSALQDLGRLTEALESLRRGHDLGLRQPDWKYPSGQWVRDAECLLGQALLREGDTAGALLHVEKAVELDPNDADARRLKGHVLRAKKDTAGAIECLRAAMRLDPSSAIAYSDLGSVLCDDVGEFDQAIDCLEKAIGIDRTCALAHYNLGVALAKRGDLKRGDPDRAIACYREALRLDPTLAYNLGIVFADLGDHDRAITCCRAAIQCNPGDADAQCNLGVSLAEKREFADAIDACRKAIELRSDFAEAHCFLGLLLMQEMGRYGEALECMRRGHELGRQRPDWDEPSDRWVQEAERLVALEARLPDVLAGQDAAPGDVLTLADMCLRFKKRYGDAVLLFRRAFDADPSLVGNGARYNAACAAALAAAGEGGDEAHLRELALDWLEAELSAYRELPAGDPAVPGRVDARLGEWLDDPDLRGVRDLGELARLPAGERQRWTTLWREVRELKARAKKQ